MKSEINPDSLYLKLANLEDVEAEYEALCKLPADENGFKNNFNNVSFDDFKANEIKKIIAYSKGLNLPEGYVPCSIYFLWDGGKIVGVFHFRHYLCDSLRKCGGHIGYAILPEFRGQHYATKGLALMIEEVKDKIPEDEIWMTANNDNLASQKVMLNNGAYMADRDDERVHMRIKLNREK